MVTSRGSDSEDSLPQTSVEFESDLQSGISAMNCFTYAVEFDHDENLLKSHENVSHLSEFLALLTLESAKEDDEDLHTFQEKLQQLKREADRLDSKFNSPDYYTQKEELIFKVVCQIKGIDHDKWLRDEQGFEYDASLGDFLEDEFVCDDV
ncbi:uncharacterized protein LOC128261802 [Drosophila gunungcola]|uniref:Uncharacterized protein n=1 Tax=Drosophila gunungcola TaxID=103775 RepID=A0A9P9YTB3_9MUSC|nr:uncharacterized protein LOC128261802 [Drosophila gunungcola]KAI8042702.1 hypothetical protein M5D96_004019 [Drosophila gunungcola]